MHNKKKRSLFSFALTGLILSCFLILNPIRSHAATSGNETGQQGGAPEGYFDVTRYGADGTDEIADDAIIQEMLNPQDATGAEAEKRIYFPSGTYYFERPVTVYSHTKIFMEPDARIVGRQGIWKGFFKSEDTPTAGSYKKLVDVTIEGGYFDGSLIKDDPTQEKADINFLYFDHCSDITLKNITFHDSYSRHSVSIDGVDGLTAEGLKFLDCYRNDITTKGGDTMDEDNRTSEAFHIDHISTDGISAGGAKPNNDGLPSKNVTITNCTFDNVNSGVGCHYTKGVSQGENLTIENCKFTNVRYTPIDLTCYDNVKVSGNTVDKTICMIYVKRCNGEISNNTADQVDTMKDGSKGSGIIVTLCDTNTSSKPLVIKGNTIKKAKKWGICTMLKGESGEGSVVNKYVRILNNTIQNSGSMGVRVDNSENITISGNKITSAGENGIYAVSSKNLTVNDNTINTTVSNGITLSDCNGQVKNNTVSGSAPNGINLTKSRNLTVSGNTVSKCTTYGIRAESVTKLVVEGNSVSSVGSYGIFIKSCTGSSENNQAGEFYRDPACFDTFVAKEYNGLKGENGNRYYYYQGVRQSGWKTLEAGKYFFEPSTMAATIGFRNIQGLRYYFHTNAVMKAKTFFTDNNKRYYADAQGVVPVNKIFSVDGRYYYAGANGVLQTGWQTVDNKKYYFSPTNYSAETGFREHDGYRYFFNSKGVMRTGWIDEGGKRYRADSTGKLILGKIFTLGGKYYYAATLGALQTGWKTIGKDKYYFNPKTGEAKTGFMNYNGARYYFTAKGVMKTGFFKVGSNKYYATNSGKIPIKTIFKVGKKVYYAKAKGVLKTGWLKLGQKSYFFDPKTYAADTGFSKRGGKLYYFRTSGVMKTGWIHENNKDYYTNKKGVVYTNKTFKVGSKRFKADAKGVVTELPKK